MHRALTYPRTLVRNRQRWNDAPRLLTYTVTFTCNARCVMCDSWRLPRQIELTVPEIEAIFRQLPRLDAVRLTGGEPFVRRDLDEIVALAEGHLDPVLLHITTNGFLTDRIVELCELRDRRTPLHLLVSLDGVGAAHDRVRGHAQAWERATETLRALAPRREELSLRLAVNQTIIDAEGHEQYLRLREVLRPMEIPHHIVMAYETSATYSLTRHLDLTPRQVGEFTPFGRMPREALQALLDQATEDVETLPLPERIAKRYYLAGVRERLLASAFASANPTLNPPCAALRSHLRIFPNGDVPTCQFHGAVVGNLREVPFEVLWRSDAIETQRAVVDRCAGCWAECEVLPSAIYSGDLARVAFGARRSPNPVPSRLPTGEVLTSRATAERSSGQRP